jgi:hypothetical protein
MNHAALPSTDFQVLKEDLATCRFVDQASQQASEVTAGHVLLAVDRFAFTANNITYANFGQEMGYWGFYPADEGWGRVPVWGFADVLGSQVEGINPGDRVFGFLPMSTHVVMQPGRVSQSGFVDALPHRQGLHAVYNQYQLCAADPGYQQHSEDLQMLLRPLFITSFLIDDFLADNDFFAAHTVILSSASSKTAMGLAHLLGKNRSQQCRVIGLTSGQHLAHVQSLGCYDQVCDYSQISSLPSDDSVVYVDMAGNGETRSLLHHHFGERLKHDCVVGNAHGQKPQPTSDLPGVSPEFFFAPARIQKREQDWGRGGVMQRFGASWVAFLPVAGRWLQVERQSGRSAVERIYHETLRGNVSPEIGNVLSLTD